MSFSRTIDGSYLSDSEILKITDPDQRSFEAWRAKVRPYQMAKCVACHEQSAVQHQMRAEARHSSYDESLAFLFTSGLVRLGRPSGSRLVTAFKPLLAAHSLFSETNTTIHRELEDRVSVWAELAGVPPEVEIATVPLALTGLVQLTTANENNIQQERVVDLGPVIQPSPLPVSDNNPKLVFRVGMEDSNSYRIYSMRIRYLNTAPASAIKPIRIKRVEVRLGGDLVDTASTFFVVDDTLQFSSAVRELSISNAAMILPHRCGDVVAPCGEMLSFSVETLAVDDFGAMKSMVAANCAGCHAVSRNYNGSLTMPAFASQANLALAQDQFIGLFAGNAGFIRPRDPGASVMSQVLGATATGQLSLMPPSANATTRAQLKPVMDAWINSIAP